MLDRTTSKQVAVKLLEFDSVEMANDALKEAMLCLPLTHTHLAKTNDAFLHCEKTEIKEAWYINCMSLE